MKYTQLVFLYDTYVKNKSHKSSKRKFCCIYPGIQVAASSAVFEFVKKVCSTESVLAKKYTRHNNVLTEEKLHETGARIEDSSHNL
jgi:hypothetical protein